MAKPTNRMRVFIKKDIISQPASRGAERRPLKTCEFQIVKSKHPKTTPILLRARRVELPIMRFALFGCMLSALLPALAQERVTSVEGITEYKLGNGLHVLLF